MVLHNLSRIVKETNHGRIVYDIALHKQEWETSSNITLSIIMQLKCWTWVDMGVVSNCIGQYFLVRSLLNIIDFRIDLQIRQTHDKLLMTILGWQAVCHFNLGSLLVGLANFTGPNYLTQRDPNPKWVDA